MLVLSRMLILDIVADMELCFGLVLKTVDNRGISSLPHTV